LRRELAESQRRRNALLAGAALFLGGVLWLALLAQPEWLGWALAAGGGSWMLS
jgi:hypothetical protein